MNVTLLIPIFDHGETIGDVVAALEPHGLPCLVVDDGSGPATREVLDALERRYAFVSIVRHKRNGGRGAALKTGYRVAQQRGFGHAIQLDADGQHRAADVPRFLSAIGEDPAALVLGAPRFDASAPRARLYGRQLSRAMVWLTTLSFAVEDPLCGFRGVPLAPACALLAERTLGDHMEFDPQLVIELVRRGVPVRNVTTQVVYAEGGLSHFQMLDDNLRLSGVYTRALATLPAYALGWGGGAA